ncbi:MAG TPA: DUF488 domain-containing protein [Reyranellaceae bacterium]|nr:DUF488 domain-containing protein [Reyranellaceae bacterium]
MTIKTIGHSNHPIEHFVGLLKKGGVDELIDVRSKPYSRRFPQFSRERLAQSLAEAGIAYLWEGESLGGKPRAAPPKFEAAIDRVMERATERNVALMCAEKEPLDCHRVHLVARRLAERGADIEHLLADGAVRPHREVEEALLKKEAGDLFEDRAARLARAYDARVNKMWGD